MLQFIARWKFLLAALFALSLTGCAVVPYQSSGYIGTGSTYYSTPPGYRNHGGYGNYTGSPYGTFGSSGAGIGLQYYGGGRSHDDRGRYDHRPGASHHGARGGNDGRRGGHRRH